MGAVGSRSHVHILFSLAKTKTETEKIIPQPSLDGGFSGASNLIKHAHVSKCK